MKSRPSIDPCAAAATFLPLFYDSIESGGICLRRALRRAFSFAVLLASRIRLTAILAAFSWHTRIFEAGGASLLLSSLYSMPFLFSYLPPSTHVVSSMYEWGSFLLCVKSICSP